MMTLPPRMSPQIQPRRPAPQMTQRSMPQAPLASLRAPSSPPPMQPNMNNRPSLQGPAMNGMPAMGDRLRKLGFGAVSR